MEIEEKTVNNITVYSVKGQILLTTEEEYRKSFDKIAEEKSHMTVILNMSGVGYVNSVGVNMIVNCYKKFKKNGGRLLICGLVPGVAKLFDIIRLTEVIEIYPDEETAIKSVTSM